MKEEKGITLVALVITIIIIIILATVTISMAFGDNGLIKQAELAKDLTANSMSYEEKSMANLVAYMNIALGTGGSAEVEEPDLNEITPPEETNTIIPPEPVVNTFTFSIDGVTYTAEEGMTWEQWVSSEYNNGGFLITINNCIAKDVNAGQPETGHPGEPGTTTVRKYDGIIENQVYDFFYGYVTYSSY